jgi:hypothetical protein
MAIGRLGSKISDVNAPLQPASDPNIQISTHIHAYPNMLDIQT